MLKKELFTYTSLDLSYARGLLRNMLRIGVCGINEKRALLELRERVARRAESFISQNLGFPHLLLSTCNRTELYFSGEGLWKIGDFFSSHFPERDLFYFYTGVEAFSHLCKVTSGLDSALLGETEIQHQVRLAYARAAKRRTLSKELHFVCQKALRVGKQVRKEWLPSPLLFFEMLWQVAEEHCEGKRVDDLLSRVLLVGWTEMNRRFAHFLQQRGSFSLALATSHFPLTGQIPGVEIASRLLLQEWQRFDWLIFAARASDYLLKGEGESRQLLFDLSVPRNVDPSIQGVSLWNIEEIQKRCVREEEHRRSLDACHRFVEESAERYQERYIEKSLILSGIGLSDH
ncbi:MAG: hypothetical protein KGI80_05550 [Verrucomicrobiota bacterium]|nr:hypothetical protein [Verrucomicrobiota bacterium]